MTHDPDLERIMSGWADMTTAERREYIARSLREPPEHAVRRTWHDLTPEQRAEEHRRVCRGPSDSGGPL